MPRLKTSVMEKKNAGLAGTIKKYAAIYDVSNDEIIAAMGLGRSAGYKRFKHPETLTIEELRAIKKRMNIPLEELAEYLF